MREMQTMLDIKIIIEQYPQSLADRKQLAGLLRDLFPTEKAAVNNVLTVYDSGIATEISGLSSIDALCWNRFIKILTEEYGLREQAAATGVKTWANAYGVSCEGIPDNDEKLPQKGIIHDPSAYAKVGDIVPGNRSDYALTEGKEGTIIQKFRGFETESMIVPNEIDGKKIVGIGSRAYENCSSVKTLTISDGIEYIQERAFAGCKKLSEIVLPSSLKEIGNSAFYGCSQLSEIVLPASVTKLGDWAFANCSALQSIDLPDEIETLDSTFRECSNLEEVTLPAKLRDIGDSTFRSCGALRKIAFPMSLREIGYQAFEFCHSLTEVILNEGLQKIDRYAFAYCNNIENFLIPSTVTSIDDDVFDGGYSSHTPGNIYCYAGTYGLEWARKREYSVRNAAEIMATVDFNSAVALSGDMLPVKEAEDVPNDVDLQGSMEEAPDAILEERADNTEDNCIGKDVPSGNRTDDVPNDEELKGSTEEAPDEIEKGQTDNTRDNHIGKNIEPKVQIKGWIKRLLQK